VKLKSFEVLGLFGREGVIAANFHDDINILTGRNGAGKTSVLKLLWYVLSGNILIALREVDFKRMTLVTSEYECTIYRLSQQTCRIDFERDGHRETFEDEGVDEDGFVSENAEDRANAILREVGSSVFLPTFRRIEGGFTIGAQASNAFARVNRTKGDIEQSLAALSTNLSHNSHIFVSSISTADIVTLLVKQYSDLSDLYTQVQQSTSQGIIETIKAFKSDANDVRQIEAANRVLDNIRQRIESMERRREEIMTPIEAVRGLVKQLFRHQGIKIGNKLSFGDAASAVNSDTLSAGEKQLLSFICYNAFYRDSVIVIDEPELSLHVDWQRQLFPILQKQHSTNQFIIATHSPFIYSKYADKEISISADRGDGLEA
jgi:predicted ATP-binding protein involved in virulence